MNRLQNEKSPYLQMHANNPVDWYPWGREAFDEAEKRDAPIFLSIGYSSCHWCHVIARESFEDERVAALINQGYVPVKVDKEERPDVDAVYMDAVQLATGSGGWPMTLLLTPRGAPFFAATYLPKESRDGMTGLIDLLNKASDIWKNDRKAAERSADEFVRSMKSLADRESKDMEPSEELCDGAARAFYAAYDRKWGGFGRAPKFPSAHNLLFLMKHYERTGDQKSLDMATGTLDAMFRGGLFDHLGGGFCRYSVDREWLTPHFEKMLYDNALLLWAYAEAWRVTGNTLYRDVAARTGDYILREMTDESGAFYCAQDADSEGREGAFYVFTPEEIISWLGENDGARFCKRYGVIEAGNFEGGSILNLLGAEDFTTDDDALRAMRNIVFERRRERMPLGLDDKALTSWNALTITALCEAARALKKPEYLTAARRAEDFLKNRLTDEGGAPLLRYRDGEARGDGVLADYAYLTLALMELYQSTREGEYLARAARVANMMLSRFGGGEGLYLYADSGEQLITRPKETWDAAMPSGNSCAALALTLLARLTGDGALTEAACKQMRFVAGMAAEHPTGHGFALLAVEEWLRQASE